MVVVIRIVLVEQGVVQICHRNTISLEEPLLELTQECSLEGSYVLVQLKDLVFEELVFFDF